MTATVHGSRTWLECDGAHCLEVAPVGLGESTAEARDRLAREGWQAERTGRRWADRCPRHAAPAKAVAHNERPADYRPHAGHRPRCSCGWRATGYYWSPAKAREAWLAHRTDALKGA